MPARSPGSPVGNPPPPPASAEVTDRVQRLLLYYASVHRGAGLALVGVHRVLRGCPPLDGAFLDARDDQVMVFTRNTTDALNSPAACVPGETVMLDIEHHANFLPWTRNDRRVVRARLLCEAAQLGPHHRISLRESRIDYLACSGHKLYAPFGAGVLVGGRCPLGTDATAGHAPCVG